MAKSNRTILSLCSLLLLSGCSQLAEVPPPEQVSQVEVSQSELAKLPIVKVDAEHLQMGPPDAKPLIYEISAGKGFLLDMATTYKLPWSELEANAKGQVDLSKATKMIQVVVAKRKVLNLPFEENKLEYSITPDGGLQKGQRLPIAIGYSITSAHKQDFYPVWVSLVDVK